MANFSQQKWLQEKKEAMKETIQLKKKEETTEDKKKKVMDHFYYSASVHY